MASLNFINRVFLCAFLVFVFASCNDSDTPEAVVDPVSVRALTPNESKVSVGSGNFAFDLMTEVEGEQPQQNFFISSFSVATALSMVMNGATEDAQERFIKTLRWDGMSVEEVNESYRSLIAYIYGLDPDVNVSVANSNWYSNKYTIQPAFENILTDYYSAEVFARDFQEGSTLTEVNGWVEENTQGKIKDILDRINPDDVMFLINAIYFKAQWSNPFDEDATTDKAFTLADGSTVKVPTMIGEVKHWTTYWAEVDASVIEIPYGNENYGLTIIMPANPQTIEGLISNISADELNAVLADTVTRVNELHLPKIKLDFKTDLKQNLIDMGMPIASLDNLFEESLPLEINKVIHQSFLEVNEEGTEAAAATVVGIELTSLPAATQIDRPFLFFIRERNSHTILFSGKLVDPR